MQATKKVKLSRDNILLIIVAGLASYMDAALLVSLGVALPIWAANFHLNSWLVGVVSTLLTVAVALGSLAGGWLSDRFGRVRVFNLDILFVGIGAWVIAVSHNIVVLLIGVVIAGLASGADLPTSLAVISERVPKAVYGRAIALTQMFWSIGILLSQFLGFLTANAGMGSPMTLFGFIGTAALLNWLVRVSSKHLKAIEEAPRPADQQVAEGAPKHYKLSTLLKNSTFIVPLILLTVFYLFWNLPANTWGSFVNYFLVTVGGRSQSYSTLIGLIANILGVVLTIGYLRLADTKYRYPAMVCGLIVALAAFIAAGSFSSQWQVFTIAYILYSGSNVFTGETLYKIWSQTFYPVDARATLTGFSYGFVRICTAIFSLITPTLMGYSPKLLLWIMVLCTAVFGGAALAIVALLKRRHLSDAALNATKG
ncbi:MFS transporter [Lacticaseibacillus sp. GG6-2]